MKAKKLPRNSRIYTRERMLDVLLPRLHKPGRIVTLEAWDLCKSIPGVLSYDVCREIFHSIMLDMIKQNLAGYTHKKGIYSIRKRIEKYTPVRIEIPIKEKYEAPDEQIIITRPPSLKSTQDQLIEKYLNS